MDKNVRDTSAENTNRIYFIKLVFFISVLMVTGISVFLHFYNRYNDKILYAERLKQMREVTSQLFSGLEDVTEARWESTRMQYNFFLENAPESVDELADYMEKQTVLSGADNTHTELIAVDEEGIFYTKSGRKGLLSERRYLLGEPQQISFLSDAMFDDHAEMIYLIKLKEPLALICEERTVTITYYGIMQDMKQLSPYFECDAYDGNNGMYVVDEQGLKIFSDNVGNILPGYNVYSVLEQMDYLHGTSFLQAKEELDEQGMAYSNAVLNGEEYYYALYRMNHAAWTLVFTVPSRYVATNTVDLVKTSVGIFLVFAVVMLCICAALIFILLTRQQKIVLEQERRNNEKLAVALTKAEHAEQSAKEANKAKSDFLANMSHDIRTPMNAIVGIVQLMEHNEDDSEKMDIYIRKIKSSSRHLLSLINDILDMSKIEATEVTLNREKINLAEQVAQMDSMIRPQVEKRKQTFSIRVHEIVHENLIGDAVRLRQVIINLLSNAVKYTPEGGNIVFDLAELSCEEDVYKELVGEADKHTEQFGEAGKCGERFGEIGKCGERFGETGKRGEQIDGAGKYAVLRFTVTDNGYGMTPKFVAHIFEPFTRAENSTTNKIQGTGLGMAITKNIVDLMGGRIRIQSEPDKGSYFEVTVPVLVDKDVEQALPVKKVLLLSDNTELIRNIRASFQEPAAELFVAHTCAEAVGLLQGHSVDTILLGADSDTAVLSETVQELRAAATEGSAKATDVSAAVKKEQESTEEILIFLVEDSVADAGQRLEIGKNSNVSGVLLNPFFFYDFVSAVNKIRGEKDSGETEKKSVLKGMRFLCAEDNELNAEILDALLDMNGAACQIYPDGQKLVEAFQTVKPGDYDVILMDVQMPNMNGIEATKAIRNGDNPLGRSIPIIAMTANVFSSDVQECLNAGMDAHLPKPLDMEMMERTIQALHNRIGGTKAGE